MTEDFPSETLLVIGLGVLGGSILRAAREAGLFAHYLGFDAKPETITESQRLGSSDNSAGDIATLARQADLIVIAVPVLAFGEIFQCLRDAKALDCYISDVGSVKAAVVEAASQACGETPANFVPAHPIAGSEQSGLQAARGDLFKGRRVIVTPHAAINDDALTYVSRFWNRLGANVVSMDAVEHDTMLASTSHLPHVLAYVLVNTLLEKSSDENVFDYAAGGFRDFSRIASSSPVMWRDILLANKTAVLEAMDEFELQLRQTRKLIDEGDGEGLLQSFSRAKAARDIHVDHDRE